MAIIDICMHGCSSIRMAPTIQFDMKSNPTHVCHNNSVTAIYMTKADIHHVLWYSKAKFTVKLPLALVRKPIRLIVIFELRCLAVQFNIGILSFQYLHFYLFQSTASWWPPLQVRRTPIAKQQYYGEGRRWLSTGNCKLLKLLGSVWTGQLWFW